MERLLKKLIMRILKNYKKKIMPIYNYKVYVIELIRYFINFSNHSRPTTKQLRTN
jgi:hypothetical protein